MTVAQEVVFVVDDDPLVRETLERLLTDCGYQVCSFACAEKFLNLDPRPASGCLVLDLDLPGLDGLELQQRLHTDQTPLPIVFLTGMGDIPTSVRAMKNGATDFLTKPVSDGALRRAVRIAMETSRKAYAEHLQLAELRERFAALTARETEVLRLAVDGLLNKQIAAQLGITEKTVKVHRGNIKKKLGVQSLLELAHLTERAGIMTESRE
jgi:FixJ family two-component response regulator